MSKRLHILANFCGALTLLAALPAWSAPLRVVATLPSLAAIAQAVGGSQVEVEALTSPRQDPHFADAKPSLIVTLNRADVVLLNGLELEAGWLPPLLVQARNPRIQKGALGHVEAARWVQLLAVPRGPIDRAEGDVHPGGNPHFLLDPRAASRIAEGLGSVLAKLAPAQAATFAHNANELVRTLTALTEAERGRFARLPAARRNLVGYHDSLRYWTDWLDLRQVATLEPRPGIAPSPQQLASVLTTMKATATRVVVQEAYYPQNTARTLTQLAAAHLVVFAAGPQFPGETYAAWLAAQTEALHAAMVQ